MHMVCTWYAHGIHMVYTWYRHTGDFKEGLGVQIPSVENKIVKYLNEKLQYTSVLDVGYI